MVIVVCYSGGKTAMNFNPIMHKLSNGITVILDSMDSATDEFYVCFHTGGYDEKPTEYGITHFIEHMFCKGTPKFPTARIAKDYIANNSGFIGASTSRNNLLFYGRIIAENLDILIDFTADRIKNSLFDKNVLEKERGVIMDELRRSLSDTQTKNDIFRIAKLFNMVVPDGKPVLGNVENIQSFTREQMMDFISKHISAKNCTICISGKIKDSTELLNKLENLFSFLPTIDVPERNVLTYTPTVAHRYVPDSQNVKLEILFPALYKDIYENMYQRMCVHLFNTYLGEKLFDVLRSDNSLTYGVRSVLYGDWACNVNGIQTQTSPENVAYAVELIAKTVYDIYTNNLPDEEYITKYRNKTKLGMANLLEDNEERCECLLANWNSYQWVYDIDKINELRNIINPEDVKKYTHGYFDGDMSILTYGPEFDADLVKIWRDNFK